MTLGRESQLVEHNIIKINDAYGDLEGVEVHNIILESENADEYKWICESTRLIAETRSVFLSSYVRWSLSINGLFVAHEKYSDPKWKRKNGFVINSIRRNDVGKGVITPIVKWSGEKVAEAHIRTSSMMAAWGIIDLYSSLEKFVFELYKIYFDNNPADLIQGKENRELRRLYENRNRSEEDMQEWEIAWGSRKEKWHRKKVFDGIDRIILSYCTVTGLLTVSDSTHFWQNHSKCIKAFSVLRNCLIHGVEVVTEELFTAVDDDSLKGLDFKKDQKLEVGLKHLQSIDNYLNSLLSAFNTRLLDLYIKNAVLTESKA